MNPFIFNINNTEIKATFKIKNNARSDILFCIFSNDSMSAFI